MALPDWASPEVDLTRPNAARVYDYMLGGLHNFAVDRQAAGHALALMPDAAVQAQANRAFMRRAVHHLIGAGVDQFLDIGSGIPTAGNVHELAPGARVVYVDVEPVAVAHSELILAGNPNTAVLREDVRRPGDIVNHPKVRALLDFDRPVAVLLVALLHYLADADDPYRIVGQLRDALCPGSYLVVAHLTDEARPEEWAGLVALSQRAGTPVRPRGRAHITDLFAGFDLIEPGLVWGPAWRPEGMDPGADPHLSNNLVGVGRLPARTAG